MLPRENLHVTMDLKKVQKGDDLSPVLLVRGDLGKAAPLEIADGYHRVRELLPRRGRRHSVPHRRQLRRLEAYACVLFLIGELHCRINPWVTPLLRDTSGPVAGLQAVRRNRFTLTEACAEALEGAIEIGIYQPGGRLPSEAELAEQLAVSRPTLRESLRLLEERGRVRRYHGRGTFVSERPAQEALNRNFGITSMIRARGCEPSTRDGRVVRLSADRELVERLGLEQGDPVWRVERVRMADDHPVVFSIDSLPEYLSERYELDEIVSGREPSLYSLLGKCRNIAVQRGEAEVFALRATAELRSQLEVKLGVAILCVKQVDFDQHGTAVVYSVEYHVPDWASFRVERVGPGAARKAM